MHGDSRRSGLQVGEYKQANGDASNEKLGSVFFAEWMAVCALAVQSISAQS